MLAGRGVSELLIGRLLGHAWAMQTVTGRHYVQTRIEDLKPVVSSLDEWLGGGDNSATQIDQSS